MAEVQRAIRSLTPEEIETLRPYLFTLCETQEELHAWILTYLGIDLPTSIVDPDSTSSPMALVWEVYDAMLHPDTDSAKAMSRIMAYAARDSFKTLCAAILEIIVMCHFGRSVGHMAAIEDQAKNSQAYVKEAIQKPILRDFVDGSNAREVKLLRYRHKETGFSINNRAWADLPVSERDNYIEFDQYVKIVICTLQATNSLHVPFFVVDEVDVIPEGQLIAYRESIHIPSPPRYDKGRPITLLISTRKFSWAMVQQEIDNAPVSGLVVRHWNIIDVTEACPPSRHLPNEPKIDIYRSDDTLRAISPEEYTLLNSKQKSQYTKDQGYAGCLKNCKLFSVCKGNLATKQKSTSPMLKPIDFVQQKFKETDPANAKAQLLCRKPSESGLIYPYFDRDVHMLTSRQIAERVTGKTWLVEPTKADLIQIFKEAGADFYAGMDHGFTHYFSVVSFAVLGTFAYVFDVFAMAGLELDQKISHIQHILNGWDPAIFPDTAYPSDNTTFKRKGFRMRNEWVKGPDSIIKGIQIVRTKLHPALGEPTLYFLKDDPGVEELGKRFSKYAWALDKAGQPTDKPSKQNDDELDAIRYGIMNVFTARGTYIASGETIEDKNQAATGRHPYSNPEEVRTSVVADYMKQVIAEQTGSFVVEEAEPDKTKRKPGGIIWEI